MKKLNLYVCEFAYQEFINLINEMGINEINLVPYPSVCDENISLDEMIKIIKELTNNYGDGVILINSKCKAQGIIKSSVKIKVIETNISLRYLINKEFALYIIEKKGFAINYLWLKNWKVQMEVHGFNHHEAKKHYKEAYDELVLFDFGYHSDSEVLLKEFSEFVDIPYTIIHADREDVIWMIKNIICEWKMENI